MSTNRHTEKEETGHRPGSRGGPTRAGPPENSSVKYILYDTYLFPCAQKWVEYGRVI